MYAFMTFDTYIIYYTNDYVKKKVDIKVQKEHISPPVKTFRNIYSFRQTKSLTYIKMSLSKL